MKRHGNTKGNKLKSWLRDSLSPSIIHWFRNCDENKKLLDSNSPACPTDEVLAESSSYQLEEKQRSRFEVMKSPILDGQSVLKEELLEIPMTSSEHLTSYVIKENDDVS